MTLPTQVPDFFPNRTTLGLPALNKGAKAHKEERISERQRKGELVKGGFFENFFQIRTTPGKSPEQDSVRRRRAGEGWSCLPGNKKKTEKLHSHQGVELLPKKGKERLTSKRGKRVL